MQLIGLPDARKIRKAECFRSIAQCLRILRKGFAATTASDEGAINVWKDRHGRWRGERQRYMIKQSETTCTNLDLLRAWLKEQLPKIERS